jgi:hypothetical protein
MDQPCEFQVDALGVLQTSRNRSAFSSQTPNTRIGYLQTHRRPGLRCHFPRGISSAIDCCIIDKRMPQSILDASTPSPPPPPSPPAGLKDGIPDGTHVVLSSSPDGMHIQSILDAALAQPHLVCHEQAVAQPARRHRRDLRPSHPHPLSPTRVGCSAAS